MRINAYAALRRSAISNDAVRFEGVRFAWPGRVRFRLSIDAFTLDRGERLLLVGPSGSGKSTFLSLLAGIAAPDQGRISVLGTDLGALKSHARDRFRASHFGIIFQQFNLLPYASVVDNVVLPLSFSEARRARAAANGAIDSEARRLLARLGLDAASIEGARASNLSVGQQQRVAAARALIGSPELIVAAFPSLSPEQVRGAIDHYLSKQDEIDQYLEEQEARWKQFQDVSQARQDPLLQRMRARSIS